MLRAERGACDEGREGYKHSGVPAADRIQRAGSASATQLHSHSKQKGPYQHADSDGTIFAMNRLAEKHALAERREKEHDGNSKHDHLRAQACPAAVGYEDSPGRSKSEQRVIKRETKSAAKQIERPRRHEMVVERAAAPPSKRANAMAATLPLIESAGDRPVSNGASTDKSDISKSFPTITTVS